MRSYSQSGGTICRREVLLNLAHRHPHQLNTEFVDNEVETLARRELWSRVSRYLQRQSQGKPMSLMTGQKTIAAVGEHVMRSRPFIFVAASESDQ